MVYSKQIGAVLRKFKIAVGDRVAVRSGSQVFEGILMPRTEAGDENSLVLKLDSGYNVGVKFGGQVKIEKLAAKKEDAKPVPKKLKKVAGLPEIALISTGGTISAHVDYKFGGVSPAFSPEEILSVSPELEGVVNFKSVTSPFRVFSENMTPREWQAIAKEVAKELNSGAAGAIVTHGTDTLSYTAAALSFMLKDLGKPVALVGAQRSPDRGSFDGPMNLLCAAHYAGRSDIAEVAVVMHSSSSDDSCFAIRGTKARKMHTSRRDAFRPINDLPLAAIWPDGRIEKMQECKPRGGGKVVADTKFEERVALLKAYPGSPPELVDFLVDRKYRGIVVEATALGHVPVKTRDEKFSWLPAIKRALDKGVAVAFATQCLYGTTNAFVYETARQLHSLGVIYCGDMLPEVAYIKLGCVLSRERKMEKIRGMMLANIAGELNPRLTEKHFVV